LEDVCRTNGHAQAAPFAAILVNHDHTFCHLSLQYWDTNLGGLSAML
jgi:hypothetical protein